MVKSLYSQPSNYTIIRCLFLRYNKDVTQLQRGAAEPSHFDRVSPVTYFPCLLVVAELEHDSCNFIFELVNGI